MLHRLRKAMQDETTGKLGGGGHTVEVDETFIGGKLKNMHKDRKPKLASKHGGAADKTIVVGMLERNGESRPKSSRLGLNPSCKLWYASTSPQAQPL